MRSVHFVICANPMKLVLDFRRERLAEGLGSSSAHDVWEALSKSEAAKSGLFDHYARLIEKGKIVRRQEVGVVRTVGEERPKKLGRVTAGPESFAHVASPAERQKRQSRVVGRWGHGAASSAGSRQMLKNGT